MEEFKLLASPFYINFLILVPLLLFLYLRKHKLSISSKTLLYTLIFGIAFGVIEASSVIYLRAATGLLPGYEGTIIDVWRMSKEIYFDNEILLKELPKSLFVFELIREAGTIVMISMIALIAANKWRERVALFLWVFAVWDIIYYVHLYLMVRWPQSLLTSDVLFLIPEPWFGQVWFPVLISGLTMLAIIFNLTKQKKSS